MKFRNSFFLLIIVLFLSACTKEMEQGQLLYASHEDFAVLDLQTEGQEYHDFKYLLTKETLYVAGMCSVGVVEPTAEGTVSRLETATVLYGINLSTKESKLLGEYPMETVCALCEGENGTLAAVMARSVLPTDGSREMQTEYVLRIVGGEKGEDEEFNFTSLLDTLPDFGLITAIDIKGEELAVADLYAKTLCVLNFREGTLKQAVAIEGYTDYLRYDADGTLYAVQNENNGTLYSLTSNAVVLTKHGEGLAEGKGAGIAYDKQQDTLYMGTAEAVYAYDMTGQEMVKLFSCGEYDIFVEGEFQILHHGEKETDMWQILTVNPENKHAEIATLSATTPDGEAVEEKEVIVLSNYWSYPELQKMVTAFNKSSDKYRVEIKVAPFSEDYDTYIQKRNMEVLAGNGPDLFSTSGSEYQTYANAGYLVDLKPYMQELDNEKYLEHLLYGEAQDGKCYAAVTGFQIHLAIGRSDIIGERTGWTFEEMCQVMEEHPEIEALLPFADEMTTLQYCCVYGGVACDDYETLRECMLFAEKYGVNIPLMEAVLGENVLLQEEVILTPRDLQYLMEVSDKYVMVGYPNADRNGIFRSGSTWSINANSGHVEGAWEFIKFLLTEYQYEEQDMPVLKEAYDAKVEAAMIPNTYMDYNVVTGKETEVEEPYSVRNGVALYAMSKEQVQAFHELVENANASVSDFDWGAWNIISEEAGAYFNGDKSLDDVMEVIEGRMQIYISERE